jgi:hypothetical protein
MQPETVGGYADLPEDVRAAMTGAFTCEMATASVPWRALGLAARGAVSHNRGHIRICGSRVLRRRAWRAS